MHPQNRKKRREKGGPLIQWILYTLPTIPALDTFYDLTN